MSHDHFNVLRDDGVDESEGVVLAKGVAMAVLFSASMICGLVPMLLAKKFQWLSAKDAGDLKSTNRVVMALLSFGGGVLLSTTFMHLMPEVDHNIEYLQGKLAFLSLRLILELVFGRVLGRKRIYITYPAYQLILKVYLYLV